MPTEMFYWGLALAVLGIGLPLFMADTQEQRDADTKPVGSTLWKVLNSFLSALGGLMIIGLSIMGSLSFVLGVLIMFVDLLGLS